MPIPVRDVAKEALDPVRGGNGAQVVGRGAGAAVDPDAQVVAVLENILASYNGERDSTDVSKMNSREKRSKLLLEFENNVAGGKTELEALEEYVRGLPRTKVDARKLKERVADNASRRAPPEQGVGALLKKMFGGNP